MTNIDIDYSIIIIINDINIIIIIIIEGQPYYYYYYYWRPILLLEKWLMCIEILLNEDNEYWNINDNIIIIIVY